MVDFKPFNKIARLNRGMVITEKIDGTNAAVVIVPISELNTVADTTYASVEPRIYVNGGPNMITMCGDYAIFAQSRTRFVTPNADNYGFAWWVENNAQGLIEALGEGYHYGEWWGSGIQRKYGLTGGDKRFSLFNTSRWTPENMEQSGVKGLGVVPELYRGMFSTEVISAIAYEMAVVGSVAAPGYDKPEGVVVYQEALRDYFKVTLEGDESPKSLAERG